MRASALSILARGTSRRAGGRSSTGCTRSTRDRSPIPWEVVRVEARLFRERLLRGKEELPLGLLEHRLELLQVLLVQAPTSLTRAPGGGRKRAEKLFCVRWAVKAARAARPEAARSVPECGGGARTRPEAGEPQAEALLVCAAGTCSRRHARREVRPRVPARRARAHGALRVDRLLLVSDHPMSPNEIRGRPIKRKLVYAVTSEGLEPAEGPQVLRGRHPPYDYTRIEKIKVAVVAAQAAGVVHDGDTILALCGPGEDRVVDTLVKVDIGSEDPEEKIRVDALGLPPGFSSQVESLVHTAMEIGAEGYEGSRRHDPRHRRLDRGDGEEPTAHPEPVRGISEAERNALDPPIARRSRRSPRSTARSSSGRTASCSPRDARLLHDVARREAADGARCAPQRRGVDHRGRSALPSRSRRPAARSASSVRARSPWSCARSSAASEPGGRRARSPPRHRRGPRRGSSHAPARRVCGAHRPGPARAYYWEWARRLDLSYFDHPPLAAWTIALTTGVFGGSPGALRLAAAPRRSSALSGGSPSGGSSARAWRSVALAGALIVPLFALGQVIVTPDAPLLLRLGDGPLLHGARARRGAAAVAPRGGRRHRLGPPRKVHGRAAPPRSARALPRPAGPPHAPDAVALGRARGARAPAVLTRDRLERPARPRELRLPDGGTRRAPPSGPCASPGSSASRRRSSRPSCSCS